MNNFLLKQKPLQNQKNRTNLNRDYEDETDLYALKHQDNQQTKQLKQKLKILISKVSNHKKEKDILIKENQHLQHQIVSLQNNLRHMVSGFSNSSSDFPMANELTAKIAQFYKCECLDIFFDLLGPQQLTLKGLFSLANNLVQNHFKSTFQSIIAVGCLQSIDGPVMNVLRKAFQSNHSKIIQKIMNNFSISIQIKKLINQIGLNTSNKQQQLELITTFLQKLVQISLQCKICDPPLLIQIKNIGKRIEFNTLDYDPFDGFIKPRQQCFIILPQITKQQGESLVKSLVLHKNYDPCN